MGNHTARRLTAAVLDALAPGESAYDVVQPGLVCRKHKSGRIDYFVRRRGKKDSLHRAIGNSTLLSLTDARKRTRDILVQHDHARMTAPGKRHSLDEAWALFKAALLAKGERRSPKTLYTYEMGMRRLSPKFRRTLLRDLADDPTLFAAEYDRIAAKHQSAADSSGKLVRTIYFYVRERHDVTLPDRSPTVDRELHSKAARDARVLREGDMRDWWRAVATLPDPVRRWANLLCLLSGMRPEALTQMRLEHQNRDDPTLWEIPKPKGGTQKAFTLILSPAMHAVVRRVIAFAGAHARSNGFLFPATRGPGPITMLHLDSKVTGFGPRSLRRGYATMAEAVGVPMHVIGRLLNHASSQPITALYVRSDAGGALLRKYQEEISARIIAAIGDPALVEEPEQATPEQIAAWTADSQPVVR